MPTHEDIFLLELLLQKGLISYQDIHNPLCTFCREDTLGKAVTLYEVIEQTKLLSKEQLDDLVQEARNIIQIVNRWTEELFVDAFMGGRFSRICGWLALTDKDYNRAKTDFAESVRLNQMIADDEQVAWSQAGLACAEIGLGNHEEAKHMLMDALWTSIEIQGFIPLIFTLPITVRFLQDEEPELAAKVYQQIKHLPFITGTSLIQDIVLRHLPQNLTKLQPQYGEVDPDSQLTTLVNAAAAVMSEWLPYFLEHAEKYGHIDNEY